MNWFKCDEKKGFVKYSLLTKFWNKSTTWIRQTFVTDWHLCPAGLYEWDMGECNKFYKVKKKKKKKKGKVTEHEKYFGILASWNFGHITSGRLGSIWQHHLKQ